MRCGLGCLGIGACPLGTRRRDAPRRRTLASCSSKYFRSTSHAMPAWMSGSSDSTCGTLDGTFDGTFRQTFDGKFRQTFDGSFRQTFDRTFRQTFDGTFRQTFDGTFDSTYACLGVFVRSCVRACTRTSERASVRACVKAMQSGPSGAT